MESHACPKMSARESQEAPESGLCASRVRQLERNLRALPGLYRESLHHVLPTSRQLHHTRVSGSRNRDRLNTTALDARHNLLEILESWAKFVADERGGVAPTRSVPRVTHFLLRHLPWLADQPPAADFADEIDGLRRELLRTIDPEPGEPGGLTRECVVADCPGTITTPVRPAGRGIHCSSGHSWDMHEWITLRPLLERQKAVGA
ncbi:hypothetical protein [Streptomyces sp. NPDC000983]|uniref:hypothetical protein n=1 Tax=Streptomyces sp. NPDC000983 TaxID=3154373 RepID=UPI00332F84FB